MIFDKILNYFETFDFEKEVNKSVIAVESQAINYVEAQLDLGRDGNNTIIRTYKARTPNVYANYTISRKKDKGQPTDKVTLKDTGAFRNSLQIEKFTTSDDPVVYSDGWHIAGDNMELISENLDLEPALQLNDANVKRVYTEMKKIIDNEINELFKNVPKI
jgi:hypothetical protein